MPVRVRKDLPDAIPTLRTAAEIRPVPAVPGRAGCMVGGAGGQARDVIQHGRPAVVAERALTVAGREVGEDRNQIPETDRALSVWLVQRTIADRAGLRAIQGWQ